MLVALSLPPEFIDITKVRYGNYSDRAIPEYKEILREKLEEGSARHASLMRTCTKKFKAALKISQGAYVLIVEVGGVKNYPTTNITQNIIKNI